MNANIFKYDTSITKERSFHIKAFAILLMLIHHLFTFSNRLPEGGYISLFSLQGLTIEQFLGGFGIVCVCIFLFLSGYYLFHYMEEKDNLNKLAQKDFSALSWFGKHSFILYMIHQPIIYIILELIWKIYKYQFR